MAFVHLHLHTEYSLLDGFARVEPVIERAAELGMPAIAITDHGSMSGVIEFYNKAKQKGIKPIIGCEMYVGDGKEKANHLVLLAKNMLGYRNIIHMLSHAYIHNFYYKPRVPKEMLKEYSEGVICLSSCLQGEINVHLKNANLDLAREVAKEFQQIYGKDYYLEVQNHFLADQKLVIEGTKVIAQELGIKRVATNDVHYVNKEDATAHDILLCIATGKVLSDTTRMRFPNQEFYFKSEEEMRELFEEELLSNTLEVANKCNLEFDFQTKHLPSYSSDPSLDTRELLAQLANEGLQKKFKDYKKHQSRLDQELSVIDEMGFNDYFLIVWDFVRFAKEKGIFVGPGRGSGGGSLVGYALDITTVNPIKYDLIFERFLNPERVSLPDFDIDFDDERRQEVIDYVTQKYGEDHVAQIITFGTLGARAAIRDVGRVMGMSYQAVDEVAKSVPFALKMTLERALKESQKLRDLVANDHQVAKLIENAMKIEGVPRHASTHAAGIVITKEPVDYYVPLYMHDGAVSTQYTMSTLESLGLVKMDFLGLRNLSILKHTLENIENTKSEKINLEFIDYEDPFVYDLISSGNTEGIFQLESSGMRSFFMELKPKNMEDIIAGISLYRPGPMDSIPKYIQNRENSKNIQYIHPKLKPILSSTYGCLIYQEQVMQIVRDLGGFSYAQADIVRRAMSKKKDDVMTRQRSLFMEGAKENGVGENESSLIFEDMFDFAKYAFNKSHAAGYAILAYQTAYLKTHYPVEFMAAIMSSVMSSSKKLARYIQNARSMDIEVLAPSVNFSGARFRVENKKIRFGLLAIKNVGKNLIDEIMKKAKVRPFENLRDFLETLEPKVISRRGIEALIQAGALDISEETRRDMLMRYEGIIDEVQKRSHENAPGQLSLFGIMDLPEVKSNREEYELERILEFEKETMGVYLSGHPFRKYHDIISRRNLNSLDELEEYTEQSDGKRVKFIAMRKAIRLIMTKKGERMAFVEVEDDIGTIELIVFPRIYREYLDILESENVIYIEGKMSVTESRSPQVIVDRMKTIDDLEREKKLFLKCADFSDARMNLIKSIAMKYPGDSPLVLFHEKTRKTITFRDVSIEATQKLVQLYEEILGKENVVLK